jgi:hypothetical protein
MGTLTKTPTISVDAVGNAVSIIDTPEVSVVKENLGRLYDLHEFDPDKLITGVINPDKVDSILYPTYSFNSNGVVVLDKNKETLSNQRTIINLTSVKTTSKKFNEVVDTEIQEFTEVLNSDTTFLANQVAALDSSIQRSRAENSNLQKTITNLNQEIESLRKQAQLAANPVPNFVGDTLSAGKFLYPDRRGNPGDTGYPLIQNMLLSKNKTARAVIYPGGDFVVSVGKFNERGVPLEPETKIFSKGWDNSGVNNNLNLSNSISFVWIYSNLQGGGQLEVGRSGNGRWIVNYGSGRQTVSPAARLQLDDSGILNLYDGLKLIWSSYGA